MAKPIAYFRGTDGVIHHIEEGGVAFDLVSADGSFTRITEKEALNPEEAKSAQPATETTPAEKPIVLSRLNKADLTTEAGKRGIKVDPVWTNKQIIAAIEAKDVESEPEADSKPDADDKTEEQA